MKIYELLNLKPKAGDLGVEIEVEADNLPPEEAVSDNWIKTADNSLRGESAEFVLNKPLSKPNLEFALRKLSKAFTDYGTRIRPTYRAGIHVHVNVQNLTPTQLISFICAYYMMEEVMIAFCDKSRAGNHFCLRMSDASYPLERIVQAIQDQNLHLLNDEDLRYGSLNITSLFKYGSIEFRALESTLDTDRIMQWAGALLQLRDYAAGMANPTELLNEASLAGFVEYAAAMLGPYYKAFKSGATHDNIQRGVWNIQMAVYSQTWGQTNNNIFSKKNLFATP